MSAACFFIIKMEASEKAIKQVVEISRRHHRKHKKRRMSIEELDDIFGLNEDDKE